MALVNIPAHAVAVSSARLDNADFIAVRDTEQLFVVRVDKADALLGLPKMSVQPLLFKAPAVKIIVALGRVAAQQIGKANGVANFVRQYTPASGGPYCDCGYKKKAL